MRYPPTTSVTGTAKPVSARSSSHSIVGSRSAPAASAARSRSDSDAIVRASSVGAGKPTGAAADRSLRAAAGDPRDLGDRRDPVADLVEAVVAQAAHAVADRDLGD